MLKAMLGKKLKMSSFFDHYGRNFAVTEILVPQNIVTFLRTKEKDGYQSVQIGIGERKKPKRPQLASFKKLGIDTIPEFIRETHLEKGVTIGQKIKLDEVFKKGQLVDVLGVSKGKGFAGVVKRWGFSGGPRTHGQSDRERAPGSIGSTTTPGRVYKGMKMAGRMGQKRVSIGGLEILDMDLEREVLILKGAIPGAIGSFLIIKKSKKKRKTYHEQEIPNVPKLGKLEGEKETLEVEKEVEVLGEAKNEKEQDD